MKMGANCFFVFWMFSICISMAMSYSNIEDELLSTEDVDTKIYKNYWMDKVENDNNGLAARKRLYDTLHKPSSLDMQTLGDVRALVQALGTHTDKLDARTIFSDKRAYGEVKTMADMLRVNAEKLDNLTGNVNSLIDAEKVDKTENLSAKIVGKLEEMNAALTTRLDSMNPLFVSMFVLLMESTFATSLRVRQFENNDMRQLRDYFKDNIKTVDEKLTLNLKLLPVFQYYTGSIAGMHVASFTTCLDYKNNGYTKDGVYMIRIPNTNEELDVYCDQTTDNGGWLVIQRRQDGSVDFYRDWEQYKNGFGDVTGEFWLGNDHLHLLTKNAQELRVDLTDFSGNTAYAKYETFAVGSETEEYRLSVSGYSGTAGDPLDYQNGMSFSTKDRDNDKHSSIFCAQYYKGAWWYKTCHYSHLNGIYYDNAKNDDKSVSWYHWKKKYESLKKVEMKIRPKQ